MWDSDGCCSQSISGCSPGAIGQVEAGSIQKDEGRRKWPGQGAGGTWCVQCSGGLVLPWGPWSPLHHLSITQGQAAGFPQPVCCCCARFGAGRAQRGTALLAPVPSGEQGHRVCRGRVWHRGTARTSCAGVWHCPGTISVSPVVNTEAPPWFQGRRAWQGPCATPRHIPGSGGDIPERESLRFVRWQGRHEPGAAGAGPGPSGQPPAAPPGPGGERAAAGYSSSRAAHGLSQRLCVGGSDE